MTDGDVAVTIEGVLSTYDPAARATVRPALAAALGLAAALSRGGDGAIVAVDAARRLAVESDEAVRSSVSRARSAGRTWAEIGAALHSSRQAAFQRFGRADGEPGEARLRDVAAADRAVTIFRALAAGDVDTVRDGFAAEVAARLGGRELIGVWASVTGAEGRFLRLGSPFARTIGEHTVVDVPLAFESGDMIGRVAFDGAGLTTGLFVLQPEVTR